MIDKKALIEWLKSDIKYVQLKMKHTPKFAQETFRDSDRGYIEAIRWVIKHVKETKE